MRSLFASLVSLAIPAGGGPAVPHAFWTPASGLPAELVAAYQAAGITLVMGELFTSGVAGRYAYRALGVNGSGYATMVCGGVDTFIVQELWSTLVDPAGANFFLGDANLGSAPAAVIPVGTFHAYGLPNSGGATIMAEVEVDANVADSGTFTTTETQVQTITASLENGRTYLVVGDGAMGTTVADSRGVVRIREDTVAGTQLMERSCDLSAASATTGAGMPYYVTARYTHAAASGDKTFSLTMQRGNGTGVLRQEANTDRPCWLTVYIVD